MFYYIVTLFRLVQNGIRQSFENCL